MAKINISFNDKIYSVEEQDFSSAANSLKNHLQTVMNGSGAVINFDGVSYNIDSTKLSTAKNDFISYLGTTSDNGYKIVVSGVEYYIDSDKISNAIAELEIVFDNLHSGEFSGERHDDIIPQGAFYGNLVTSAFYSEMPEVVSDGDVYLYGDYFYAYSSALNGWSVYLVTEDTGILNFIPNYPVVNRDQASYGSILESINNKSIVCLDYTFSNCSNLILAPNIPKYVTSIKGAFQDCTSLISVTIPDSVTSIGGWAFNNCTSLTSVTIGFDVTTIEQFAFQDCTSLTSINIPNSITSIDSGAFQRAGLTGELVIPDSVTNLGSAFGSCEGLTSIVIGSGVTALEEGTFSHCTGLTSVGYVGSGASVEIPDSITSIDSVFSGCSGLTSVVIPDFVTSINGAFWGCSGLTSIVIPNSITSIGEMTFYGCSNLTSVEIPDSVKEIGNWAFSGCSGLTSIVIPDSVTSIGEMTFYGCLNLMSVEIPDSVKEIGGWAFYFCRSLTSVAIPNSVISIGESVFYGCGDSLRNIVFDGTTAQWKAITSTNWSNGLYTTEIICSDGIIRLYDKLQDAFPIEWNGLSVAGNTSFQYNGTNLVRVSSMVLSIAELQKTFIEIVPEIGENFKVVYNLSNIDTSTGAIVATYLCVETGDDMYYTIVCNPGNVPGFETLPAGIYVADLYGTDEEYINIALKMK